MIKVLANDGLQKVALDKLNKNNIKVVLEHYENDVLKQKLEEFDILIVRSKTKVTKDILENLSNNSKLKLIIRAGVGIDNIDVETAKSKGIVVKNTPNASSNSVAELVIGHMISACRFICDSNYSMRNGLWNKSKYEGIELKGKELGIIGMGKIGNCLAKKAEALGMKISYYTIEGKFEELKYEYKPLNDLLKNSDFISLHVPYDKSYGYLISKEEFRIMKDGVYLINCARGKVVDEESLIKALDSKKVAGAGIDVFEEEPNFNKNLLNHSRVSITPHIGASTKEAQNRIGEEVVQVIQEFLNLE